MYITFPTKPRVVKAGLTGQTFNLGEVETESQLYFTLAM